MKLISLDLARAVWLFPITELNPTGLSLTKAFLKFTERYKFKKAPKHTLDLDSEGALTFEDGEFTNCDGADIIIKLRMFTDGFVADSWSSTRDSKDFLIDAMQWLSTEYGLALPADRKLNTLFASQLTVTTDRNLGLLNPKLQLIVDSLTKRLRQLGIEDSGFEVSSIGLWFHDAQKPNAPMPFKFEKKLNSTSYDKRFFTQAPLPTVEHMALLDEFERIL
jgi:hypothetical protein